MRTWLKQKLCGLRGHGGVAFGESHGAKGVFIFYRCKRCGADWKERGVSLCVRTQKGSA
jgi:hypothetical protein